MSVDFTLAIYRRLLDAIQQGGYSFQTFEEFVTKPKDKVVVLRHDSDIWPKSDLRMALIENSVSVPATYYFRVPETFRPPIIGKIKDLGHEIGYHYEDYARFDGNYEKAIANFKNNLAELRKIYPVKTAARHGRPWSSIESLDLWKKASISDFGLIAEPYLSVDYTKVLYLTDNGSKWNADKSNIRDKVQSSFNFNIRTTGELIEQFKGNKLPDKIILNIHPARWANNYFIWFYRYLLQKAKNVVKGLLNRYRNA